MHSIEVDSNEEKLQMLSLLKESDSMKKIVGDVHAEPKEIPNTSHVINTVDFVQAFCEFTIGGSSKKSSVSKRGGVDALLGGEELLIAL